MHPITYDPSKRALTLKERKLDFERANEVWKGLCYTFEDMRKDYGEHRYITVGHLDRRMIVMVWTPRGKNRHVISMRKANAKEKKYYKAQLD